MFLAEQKKADGKNAKKCQADGKEDAEREDGK